MKFKDWFDNKLVTGGFPYRVNNEFCALDYDYVINVSDGFIHEINMCIHAGCENVFWFPMNEDKKDVGLNSIYGALYILWLAEKEKKRVYLHCYKGSNRSQAVKAAYYYMRTGEQLETDNKDYGYINRLVAMCGRGYLPPKSEMENFLTLCAENFEENIFIGGALEVIKLETINNF